MTYGNSDISVSSAMGKRTSELFLVSVIDSSPSNFPQLLLPAKFSLSSYGLNDSRKNIQGSCQEFKSRHLDLFLHRATDASLCKISHYFWDNGAEAMVEIVLSYKNKISSTAKIQVTDQNSAWCSERMLQDPICFFLNTLIRTVSPEFQML